MPKTDQSSAAVNAVNLDKEAIEKLVPHRGIALLVTSAEFNPITQTLVAKVEPQTLHFEGHFPGREMLPGHWQLESMCLAGAILCKMIYPDAKGDTILTDVNGLHLDRRIASIQKDIRVHAQIVPPDSPDTFSFRCQMYRGKNLVSSVEKVSGSISQRP